MEQLEQSNPFTTCSFLSCEHESGIMSIQCCGMYFAYQPQIVYNVAGQVRAYPLSDWRKKSRTGNGLALGLGIGGHESHMIIHPRSNAKLGLACYQMTSRTMSRNVIVEQEE